MKNHTCYGCKKKFKECACDDIFDDIPVMKLSYNGDEYSYIEKRDVVRMIGGWRECVSDIIWGSDNVQG